MSTEKSNQNVILYGVIPSTSYPLLIIFEMMLCFSLTILTLEEGSTPLLLIFTTWVVICQGKNSRYFIQGPIKIWTETSKLSRPAACIF